MNMARWRRSSSVTKVSPAPTWRAASRRSRPAPRRLTVSSPLQAREMDKSDIRAVRDSHRASALLAKRAGYDIVYVYASHDLSLAQHFFLTRYNHGATNMAVRWKTACVCCAN